MINILKQIHRIWFLFWIVFLFFIFYPFYYITSSNPELYKILNWLRKINSYLASALAGVYYRFIYEENLDKSGTYIFCANHTSNLDIMALCVLGRGRYHFMGKGELLNNPVLRVFFKTIDIAVNRESKISSFRAFKRAGANIEQGMSLIIFPEGKIDDRYPPVLHEFKNGPFRLAIEKKVPIVPVSLNNIWKIMWDDGAKYGTKPGISDIYIHKPIYTHELSINDTDNLKEEVFKTIGSKLTTG